MRTLSVPRALVVATLVASGCSEPPAPVDAHDATITETGSDSASDGIADVSMDAQRKDGGMDGFVPFDDGCGGLDNDPACPPCCFSVTTADGGVLTYEDGAVQCFC